MKKLLFMCGLIAMMVSCQSNDYTEEAKQQKNCKDVMLVMKGVKTEYSQKEVTIKNAYCTDLWICEGTTLLKHQTSTDIDFGTPTVSLTYGSHDLTIIASASSGQSVTDGVWSTTKVIDDFATTMNVTVSASSGNSRQVQLTRRSSRIKFVTSDNVPTTVTKCHIKADNHNTLDASLNGGGAFTYEATKTITTAEHGKAYTIFINVLTASLTDEEDCNVTIEFLDASDNVLYTYDRTIKQKANRCVTLTGDYFSGASNTITITSTDFDNVNQNLFD